MKSSYPEKITPEWLRQNSRCVFVFGDNTLHIGMGGAAACREEPNTYGFITKRKPDGEDTSYYNKHTYQAVLEEEMQKLVKEIGAHPEKTFLISKLGAGLANKFNIRAMIIMALEPLKKYKNVVFLGGNV